MAATATETLWGLVMYLKNNPHKSIDAMTEDDFDEMVRQFVAVNVTAATLTVATAKDWPNHYGYGTVNLIAGGGVTLDFPAKGTTTQWAADTAGIACSTTYLLNMAAVKQAQYPEDHRGEV